MSHALVIAGRIGPAFDRTERVNPVSGVVILEVVGGDTYERGYFTDRVGCTTSLLSIIGLDYGDTLGEVARD